MAFFEDLAAGSQFHRAICADTFLRIEPADESPQGRAAFEIIVNAARLAAELRRFKFNALVDVHTGRCEFARIEFTH